jgi:dihydroorotate dehydrogenase
MDPYAAVRPLLLALDPETAHAVARTLLGLPLDWGRVGGVPDDPRLEVAVAGLRLRNPIGLAAGFDKDCSRLGPLGRLGFGYVVGGTVTRSPRVGNPRPRVVRDRRRRALVNAMGLPNPGAAAVAERLASTPATTSRWVSLADEALEDAVAALGLVAPHADAIELNASSPNAGWAHRAAHVEALTRAFVARARRPVFVKLPAGDAATALAIAEAAAAGGAAGLTCANTVPVAHPRLATGRGGLSGAPLAHRTPDLVAAVRERTGLPVHACGGIASAAEALACLEAGAATIQLYTGLVFEGPGLVGRIARGLLAELDARGVSVAQLAGT